MYSVLITHTPKIQTSCIFKIVVYITALNYKINLHVISLIDMMRNSIPLHILEFFIKVFHFVYNPFERLSRLIICYRDGREEIGRSHTVVKILYGLIHGPMIYRVMEDSVSEYTFDYRCLDRSVNQLSKHVWDYFRRSKGPRRCRKSDCLS